MGFLGSVGKFFGGAAKAVAKTVTSPKKLTTAILTGGASVVAPKVFAPVEKAVGKTLYNPNLALSLASNVTPIGRVATGGQSMALNVGGLLGQVGNVLGNISGQSGIANALRTVGGVASIGSQFVPAPTVKPTALAAGPAQALPVMAAARIAAPAAASAVATVGRGFFARFPNLAAALQKYRNTGMNQVTRGRLYSMLRRFGPELLISGGILTAAAVSELMMAGPGTRRMNPANPKALRRAARRIKSFHHMCGTVDLLKTRSRRPCKKAC